MAEFGILGPLRLRLGATSPDIGGAKRRGMIARLLVDANHVVPVERLVDDLWDEGDVDTARATIQTYVSNLRKLIGAERVLTRSPGYLLVVAPGELDADRFETLVARARDEDTGPDEAVAALDEADGLWRGPALAEFASQPWARPVADRLERCRVDARGDRADALLRAGRAADAVAELEALVEQHPLDERFWRLLVIGHYRCGRQADALRAFQRARTTLVDELGVEPGPELQAIEQAVLAHDPALASPAGIEGDDRAALAGTATAGPAATHTVPDVASDLSWIPRSAGPFVGRRAALDTLVRTVTAAAGGTGRLALVGGEPGAGKTRLLAELATRADAAGCLVLYGRCDEESAGAYQPFVGALAPALRGGPPLDLGSLAADLSLLFPDLRGSGGQAVPSLDADARRHRLFEAIDRVLGELARGRTVVLLLDDVQWADPAVLLLLRHVARTVASRRIAVVVAFRSDEARPGNALQATLLDLRRHLSAADVALTGLTGEDIRQLLAPWVGDEARERRARLARRLEHDTAGNPLFVTEVVRDLIDRGGLAAGGAGLAGLDTAELPLSATVTDVVASRVARLAPGTQRFLTAAAVAGMAFDVAVAAEVAGLDEDAAMDAVDEALARCLVVDAATAGGAMAFSHALVRRALYARLATPRRVRLHLAVARALRRGDPGDADGVADIEGLARHFVAGAAAGDVRDAVRYARLAGDRALGQLAFETGMEHYRRALDLLDPDPAGPDAPERCEVLLALGDALNRGGDAEEAKERLLAAAALATRLRQPALLARAALAFGGVLPAGVEVTDPRTIGLLERALAALAPGDSPERARLLGRLAQAEYWVRPRAGRAERCTEAVAMARRVGDPRALADVLVNRYWALDGPDDVEVRLEASVEAEAIAAGLDDAELALQAGKCRLHLLLGGDAWTEARDLAEHLARRAAELRQPEYQRLALSFDAVLAGNAGRFAEAEELAGQARELLRRRGQRVHASVVHTVQLVPWRWLEDRLDDHVERIERFVAREPERRSWRALLSWMYAETGQPDRAADQLARVDLARYLATGRAFDFWIVVVPCALAAARLGDRATAGLLHDALGPYRGRNAFVGQIAFLGTIDHHLGALGLTLGRADAAGDLARALDRHRSMDAPAYAARTERLLASA